MELTKQTILKHKTIIPGIEGYLVLVTKIEKNININPDISIEVCKSLIEGLCIKALSLLSNKYKTSRAFRRKCKNDLTLLTTTAFNEVYSDFVESQVHESLSHMILDISVAKRYKKKAKRQVKEQTVATIGKISAIRNERGDISHGRNYPKNQESSIYLAKSINSITDGICSFMIEEIGNQYAVRLRERNKLNYEDLQEFNDWLNEEHYVLSVKVDYSKLLFEHAYDKYEEFFYSEYIEFMEEEREEFEDTAQDIVKQVEQSESTKRIKVEEPQNLEKQIDTLTLEGTFDENILLQALPESKIRAFATAKNLNEDELKDVIENYLFTNKEPLRDDVAIIMNIKPSLKERAKTISKLTNEIIEFVSELKKS